MKDHGRMPRITTAVTGVLTGLAAVLVLAAPAAAHARLLSSTPKDDSTAVKAVTQVTLRFSEPVKQSLTTVRVTGADGGAHSTGGPRVVDDTVTQQVSALPAGVVKVGWRTVSVDGHTIEGSFTFTNRVAPPSPSAEPSPPAASPAPTTSSAPAAPAATTAAPGMQPASGDSGSTVAGFFTGLAVVLAAGLVALWFWRRGKSRPKT